MLSFIQAARIAAPVAKGVNDALAGTLGWVVVDRERNVVKATDRYMAVWVPYDPESVVFDLSSDDQGLVFLDPLAVENAMLTPPKGVPNLQVTVYEDAMETTLGARVPNRTPKVDYPSLERLYPSTRGEFPGQVLPVSLANLTLLETLAKKRGSYLKAADRKYLSIRLYGTAKPGTPSETMKPVAFRIHDDVIGLVMPLSSNATLDAYPTLP